MAIDKILKETNISGWEPMKMNGLIFSPQESNKMERWPIKSCVIILFILMKIFLKTVTISCSRKSMNSSLFMQSWESFNVNHRVLSDLLTISPWTAALKLWSKWWAILKFLLMLPFKWLPIAQLSSHLYPGWTFSAICPSSTIAPINFSEIKLKISILRELTWLIMGSIKPVGGSTPYLKCIIIKISWESFSCWSSCRWTYKKKCWLYAIWMI